MTLKLPLVLEDVDRVGGFTKVLPPNKASLSLDNLDNNKSAFLAFFFSFIKSKSSCSAISSHFDFFLGGDNEGSARREEVDAIEREKLDIYEFVVLSCYFNFRIVRKETEFMERLT